MFQYDSRSNTQPDKTKANTAVTNKNSVQAKTKAPVQTKSLFSFSSSLENGGEQKEERKQFEPTPIKPNNTGIPTQMKERFENLSGFSFNDVKVHYNSDKPAQLQALAYTQGNRVHIGPGQEKHLQHELGHVVQQKQGIVPATKSICGGAINDDAGLEREAGRYSSLIAQTGIEPLNYARDKFSSNITNTIQRYHMDYNGMDKVSDNRLAIVTVAGGLHLHRFAKKKSLEDALQNADLHASYRGSHYTEYEQLMVTRLETLTHKEAKELESLSGTNIADAINLLSNFISEELTATEILANEVKIKDSLKDFLSKFCFIASISQLKGQKKDVREPLKSLRKYLYEISVSKRPFLTTDCGILASSLSNGTPAHYIEGICKDEYAADYHYGYTVFEDGNDEVTMESADVQIGGAFSKLPYDSSWRFEMYGTQQGQSFHDQHSCLFEKDSVTPLMQKKIPPK